MNDRARVEMNVLRTILMVTLLAPALAGGAQRTFVSAEFGNDANLCTRSMPCRGFATAIPLTDVDGEVVALDSGGYGPVTVDRAVTIAAPAGVHAAITAAVGNGITINVPTGRVVIRGLTVSGSGAFSSSGILFQTGETLHVENCLVRNFSAGIQAGVSTVHVKNTVARKNGVGFLLHGAAVRASLTSVHAEENNVGVRSSGGARTVVTRSVAAGNTQVGYDVQTASRLYVETSVATFNGWGLTGFETGVIGVANTVITGNHNGMTVDGGGSILSLGNNKLFGNVITDGSFTGTVPQQ